MTPNKNEKRGEFMCRCAKELKSFDNKNVSSDGYSGGGGAYDAQCSEHWGKAKKAAFAVVGSGNDEVLVNKNPLKVEQEVEFVQARASISTSENVEVSDFFASLLNAATVVHMLHLKSRSYAEHKALETLYEGLPDLADDLIEAYQSKLGLVTSYPTQSVFASDSIDPLLYVKGIREVVATKRTLVAGYSELQNILDEITQLLDSTIYKLSFLG